MSQTWHLNRGTPSLPWKMLADGLRSCLPVPAGGMTTDRVREMLAFYGRDVMLLIGGALLETRDRLMAATAAFVAEVHKHAHGNE